MKSYIGKILFRGDWAYNLDNYMKTYEKLTEICQLTPDEKKKGIPLIQTGNAFDLFEYNGDT